LEWTNTVTGAGTTDVVSWTLTALRLAGLTLLEVSISVITFITGASRRWYTIICGSARQTLIIIYTGRALVGTFWTIYRLVVFPESKGTCTFTRSRVQNTIASASCAEGCIADTFLADEIAVLAHQINIVIKFTWFAYTITG